MPRILFCLLTEIPFTLNKCPFLSISKGYAKVKDMPDVLLIPAGADDLQSDWYQMPTHLKVQFHSCYRKPGPSSGVLVNNNEELVQGS